MEDREKTVSCIVMASGMGTRFGENKLLARLNGKELIRYVVDTVRRTAFSEVIVVTRHDEIVHLMREVYGPADGGPPVRCVFYEGGPQSETVKRGLPEVMSSDACLFAAGDQPLLRAESVSALVEAWRSGTGDGDQDPVYRLAYGARMGNPVLFPKRYYPALMKITGDRGGGQILMGGGIPVVKVEAESESELMDIDTREDLLRAEEFLAGHGTGSAGPLR